METMTAGPSARAEPGPAAADPPEAAPFPPASRLRLPSGMTIVPQSRVEAEHFYEDLPHGREAGDGGTDGRARRDTAADEGPSHPAQRAGGVKRSERFGTRKGTKQGTKT